MPHLIFCNRYWRLAGDEFSIPALCTIVGRIIWTVLIAVVLSVSVRSIHSCRDGYLLIIYLVLSIALFTLTIIVEIIICKISLLGTITETHKRADMNKYLNYRVVISIAQFFLATIGIIRTAVMEELPCDSEYEDSNGSGSNSVNRVAVGIVACSQLCELFALCCCCYLFVAGKVQKDSSGADKHNDMNTVANYDNPHDEDFAAGLWEDRCRKVVKRISYYSCNLFGGNNINEGLEEVAKILTIFFHHDGFLDVVPSDVVAGIVLVRVEQRNRNKLDYLPLDNSNSNSGSNSVYSKSNSNSGSYTQPLVEVTNEFHSDKAKSNGGRDSSDRGSDSNVNSAVHNQVNRRSTEILSSKTKLLSGNDSISMYNNNNNTTRNSGEIALSGLGYTPRDIESGAVNSNYSNSNSNSNSRARRSINLRDPEEVLQLEDVARYSTYALAIYTHLIVLYMKPCTGSCRLFHSCLCKKRSNSKNYIETSTCNNFCNNYCCNSCCNCCCSYCGAENYLRRNNCLPHAKSTGSNSSTNNHEYTAVNGDNSCSSNYAGLSVIADNLKNTELVYVSFHNDTTTKPFAVFLDHDRSKVVVTIRGTLSLEDCITDAVVEPQELAKVGERWGFDGVGRYAHGGMLRAAESICDELENSGLLNSFCESGDNSKLGANISTPLNKYAAYSHYQLVITGHSLGAGTAALVTLLLRKKYPSIHCYAYGTPGSVLDEKSCRESASFITSVVLVNDLVCRLSFSSLYRLRNEVLDAISRAKVNKMYIMQAIFKEFASDDLMYPPGAEPESEFKKGVTAFKNYVSAKMEKMENMDLSIPGRVLHFTRERKASRCFSKSRRMLQLEEVDLSELRDIKVSTTMAADHLPDRYFEEINDLLTFWRQVGPVTV